MGFVHGTQLNVFTQPLQSGYLVHVNKIEYVLWYMACQCSMQEHWGRSILNYTQAATGIEQCDAHGRIG